MRPCRYVFALPRRKERDKKGDRNYSTREGPSYGTMVLYKEISRVQNFLSSHRTKLYRTYRRSTVHPSLIFSKIIFHQPWSCFYYNLPCVMIVHFVPALVAIFLLGALQLTVPWSLCYNLPAILDFRQPRLLFLSSFLTTISPTLTHVISLVFLPLLLQRNS